MREAKFAPVYAYSPEPPKKPPIIKVSCGIGDTDGYPAFDSESDAYATKDDSKWGFLITGGAEFHMPLTVFQVTPEGLADKGGIRLGDIVLEINEEDATQLTLTQAHEKINAASKKIHFLVKSMDDELDGYESGEEKSIVLRVPKPPPPPKEFVPTPLLGSRCWHPIMWQDPPEPPKPKKKKTKTEIDAEGNEVVIELSEDESSDEEKEEELPHHRIIRNIRRFFKERLREMQRKLSEIAEIPKILSSTLATVSQTFDKLMPCDARELKQLALRGATHRKFSYDEDLLDYELSDNPNDDGDGDEDAVDDGEEEVSEVSEQDEDGVKRSEDRELTPESDYASEVDYLGNEEDEGDEYDHEDDDDDDYNSELHEDDIKYQADVNLEKLHHDFDEEEEDEDDFLNTSYTWNLRNIPKLVLTDEVNAELNLEEKTVEEVKVAEVVEVEVEEKKQLKESQESSSALKNVKQEKLDKVERSWPWADREKIIYKQSTCHLVPRKPLGIIEQKVQLLDKQHLVTNLKQIQEQQQWEKK